VAQGYAPNINSEIRPPQYGPNGIYILIQGHGISPYVVIPPQTQPWYEDVVPEEEPGKDTTTSE
jgi:hypothetical protein